MSPPSSEFFSEFTNSSLNYHALIWSTAPHWHKKAFAWPPSDPETSLNIFRAWEIAVEAWVREAGKWLEGDERGREVLFRASSSGHDDCHAAKGPTKEVGENPETLFNWDWIPRINEAAKVRFSSGVGGARADGASRLRLRRRRIRGSRTSPWNDLGDYDLML